MKQVTWLPRGGWLLTRFIDGLMDCHRTAQKLSHTLNAAPGV